MYSLALSKRLTNSSAGIPSKLCHSLTVCLLMIAVLALGSTGCSHHDHHSGYNSFDHGKANGFFISPNSASLLPGMSAQIYAFATYKDGHRDDVSAQADWTVSDTGLASVENGLINALAAGTVTVTAEFEEFSAAAEIKISTAAAEYEVVTPEGTVEDEIHEADGQDEQIHVYGHTDDGGVVDITESVIWESSDPDIAYVDEHGKLHTGEPGQAVITGRLEDGTIVAQFKVDVAEAQLESVALDRHELNLAAGYSDILIATAVYDNGKTYNVDADAEWSSSDDSIAGLTLEESADGVLCKITGLKAGSAVITEACKGRSASCRVVVYDAKLMNLVYEQGHELTLPQGLTAEVSVTGDFSDGSQRDITSDVEMTSQDTSVVTVETGNTALLRGMTPGTAAVSAKKDGHTAKLSVTVGEAVATSLAVEAEETFVSAGNSIDLVALAGFSDGTSGENVTFEALWDSSDLEVAEVTEGRVIGINPGKVTITAKFGDTEPASQEIEVGAAVVDALDLVSDANVAIGHTLTITPVAGYSDGSVSEEVTPQWRSSDESIATVNADGVVEGIAAGDVTITASLDGIEPVSKVITVFSDIEVFAIEADRTTVDSGKTLQLRAVVHYNDGKQTDVTGEEDTQWSSGDPETAVVSEDGIVTGKKPGSVTITVDYRGKQDTMELEVKAFEVSVERLATYGSGVWSVNKDCFLYTLGYYDKVKSLSSTSYELYKGSARVTGIDIPASVELDGVYYKVTGIGFSAFRNCTGLKTLVIPDSVVSIDDYICFQCSGLTSVTIPDSVTYMGMWNFRLCTGLKTVHLGTGLTEVNRESFRDCSNLQEINIPAGVTSIGLQAFDSCSKLPAVDLPDGLTSIGDYAFKGCKALTSAVIPDSVTSLGEWAFRDCSALKTVSVGSGVKVIKINTFKGCGSMTSLIVGDNVTEIGESAFSNCTKLTAVTLPDNLTTIAKQAFYNCSGITDLDVPTGVTSIGVNAFYKVQHITYYGPAGSAADKWGADSRN